MTHLQLEVEALKLAQSELSRLSQPGLPVQPNPVAFTSTKVPKFSGSSSSWSQYRQVFDAIVHSNGWDDATAALQQAGLVGALTEHYGSTSIRDIVDRCRVLGRHADADVWRVVMSVLGWALPVSAEDESVAVSTVTISPVESENLETLLRCVFSKRVNRIWGAVCVVLSRT